MPGRKYSDEFKKELETSGKLQIAIEQELDIIHGLLGRQQKRLQINPVTDELELREVEQLKAELRATQRELELTQMERDILKKTVGIFSKDVRP